MSPEFAKQIEQARKLTPEECYRHALVSIRNHCKLECFTCACAHVHRERQRNGTFCVKQS